MKISRILHAGWLFEEKGVKILFDPIFENPFSRNCHAFPQVKFDTEAIRSLKVDAVFISHFHDDHCSFESLDLLDRSTKIFMYCEFEEMFLLLRELGFENVKALSLNEKVDFGGFSVTALLALDPGVDCVLHIQNDGFNVLNAVDSWLDPETAGRLQKISWDLVIWPFQSMREIEVLAPHLALSADRHPPPELMQQLILLNPRAVVPGSCQFNFESWSWYRKAYFPISYKQFALDVKQALPQTEIVRLNPGEGVLLSKSALTRTENLGWVLPDGDQNEDYDFDAEVLPSSTQEISMHFPKADTEKVLDFCRTQIPLKLNALGECEEPYFQKDLVWELKIFNNDGSHTALYYFLKKGKAALLETFTAPQWRTEVPSYKLQEAAFNGEALNSMYVRINEGLRPELFVDVDILQDPLLRALFAGQFAGYQKAQLRKINGRSSPRRG